MNEWGDVFKYLQKLWSYENSFIKFVNSKGSNNFDSKDSVFPLFYEELKKVNLDKDTFKNLNDIELPSGNNISEREMYLVRELISKKLKNTTDTNENFLDDIFSYFFGENFSAKKRKDNGPQTMDLYYCFCSDREYYFDYDTLNGKTFFKPGDVCPKCKFVIQKEDRIEIFFLIEQILKILSREDIKNIFLDNYKKIFEKLKNDNKFTQDTEMDDVTNALLYRYYYFKGIFEVLGKIISIGVFFDSAPTMKHSYNSSISGTFCCINELPKEIRFSEENLVKICTYQVRHEFHNSILKPVVALLQFSFYKGIFSSFFSNCKEKIRILTLFIIMVLFKNKF